MESSSPTTNAAPERGDASFPEERPQTRLSEIYADCFALVLQLRTADGFGDADRLRRRVKQQLETAERDARHAGFSDDDVHKASFALVAFIDETVHSSNWDGKETWQNKPLQLERFDRFDAGEEFFAHLEELRAGAESRPQVLEMYYLCLALGFEGRYQLQGRDQLRMLVENTNEQLRRASPHRASASLAPHGRPGDQTANEMQYKVPTWAVAAGGVLLAVLLYLGMSLYVSDEADEAVRAIEEVQRTHSQQQQ